MEHLLMELSSNLHPFGSLAIDFFQRVLLLILKFIKVYITSLSFLSFFLRERSILQIVKLNFLSLLPRRIVKIFNSMTKMTLFWFIEAQPPEIEPAKRFLPLILVHINVIHSSLFNKRISDNSQGNIINKKEVNLLNSVCSCKVAGANNFDTSQQ